MADFSGRNKRVLVLFDVDGTLTEPRETASIETKAFLAKLRSRVMVGIVGGSDLIKQREQMGEGIVDEVDYSFSENGLVAYKDGKLLAKQVHQTGLSLKNFQLLISGCFFSQLTAI